MSLRDEFLAEVEQFLLDQKLEPSSFGREALKDPKFVFDLRGGRSPNLRTIEKVKQFMQRRALGEMSVNDQRGAAA